MRRLICTDDGANKFWEARSEGSVLHLRWGRIGTKGQSKQKSLSSAKEVESEIEKLVSKKLKKGYVEVSRDEPSGHLQVTPPEAGEQSSPRYFGTSPGDWSEGANMGHCYEVQFRESPSDESKVRIATCFEHFLAAGPAEPSTAAWLWSGQWALLFIGQRRDDDEEQVSEPRAAFEEMEEMFDALNRVAPLREVVFVGIRSLASNDELEDKPSNGPNYAGIECVSDSLYGRTRNPALDVGTVDPKFEKARRHARLEPPNPPSLGKVSLKNIKKADVKLPKTLDPYVSEQVPDLFVAIVLEYDEAVMLVRGLDGFSLAHAGVDGVVQRLAGRSWTPISAAAPAFSLSPDGRRVLLVHKKSSESGWASEILEVTLESGHVTSLACREGANVNRVSYGPDDSIIHFESREKLVLSVVENGMLKTIAEHPTSQAAAYPVKGGRYVILTSAGRAEALRLSASAFDSVGERLPYLCLVWEAESRVFARGARKDHELVGFL